MSQFDPEDTLRKAAEERQQAEAEREHQRRLDAAAHALWAVAERAIRSSPADNWCRVENGTQVSFPFTDLYLELGRALEQNGAVPRLAALAVESDHHGLAIAIIRDACPPAEKERLEQRLQKMHDNGRDFTESVRLQMRRVCAQVCVPPPYDPAIGQQTPAAGSGAAIMSADPLLKLVNLAQEIRDAEDRAYWAPRAERELPRLGWLQQFDPLGLEAYHAARRAGADHAHARRAVAELAEACRELIAYGTKHRLKNWPAAERRDGEAMFEEQDPQFCALQRQVETAVNELLWLKESLVMPGPRKRPGREDARPMKRQSTNEARDRYCYQQKKAGKTWRQIQEQVNARPSWEPIATEQGVSQAAKRYAERHGKPWPI